MEKRLLPVWPSRVERNFSVRSKSGQRGQRKLSSPLGHPITFFFRSPTDAMALPVSPSQSVGQTGSRLANLSGGCHESNKRIYSQSIDDERDKTKQMQRRQHDNQFHLDVGPLWKGEAPSPLASNDDDTNGGEREREKERDRPLARAKGRLPWTSATTANLAQWARRNGTEVGPANESFSLAAWLAVCLERRPSSV